MGYARDFPFSLNGRNPFSSKGLMLLKERSCTRIALQEAFCRPVSDLASH